MTDARLIKKWEILDKLLNEAAFQIEQSAHYGEFRKFMDHREFELALDVLAEVGRTSEVNADYWWNLKKAAEVMGLRDRLSDFRRRRLNAAKGA